MVNIKNVIISLLALALLSCHNKNENNVIHYDKKLINKIDTLTDVNYLFNRCTLRIKTNGVLLDELDNVSATDPKGNYYFAGVKSQIIYKINSNGTVINHFVNLGRGPGEYLFIESLTIDNKGNLFVGDLIGRKIIKYDSLFNYISEFRTKTSYPFSEIQFNSHDQLVSYFPQDINSSIHIYNPETGKELNSFGEPDFLGTKYNAVIGNKSLIVRDKGIYYINPLKFLIYHYDYKGKVNIIKPEGHINFKQK